MSVSNNDNYIVCFTKVRPTGKKLVCKTICHGHETHNSLQRVNKNNITILKIVGKI